MCGHTFIITILQILWKYKLKINTCLYSIMLKRRLQSMNVYLCCWQGHLFKTFILILVNSWRDSLTQDLPSDCTSHDYIHTGM